MPIVPAFIRIKTPDEDEDGDQELKDAEDDYEDDDGESRIQA